jgi:hypothetical protein
MKVERKKEGRQRRRKKQENYFDLDCYSSAATFSAVY